ncbi:MAG: DNA alkylation repair protein [Cryomorphaceae bacterium]
MTFEEIANKLKNQRPDTITNGWTSEVTHGDETYGLNFSTIRKIAEDIPTDAVLADELYACANHDLKVLATYIDDPRSYTRDELNMRKNQLYPSPFAEKFCRRILAHSEHAVHFIDEWIACDDCEYRAYAYLALSELAKKKNGLSNEFYAKCLEGIAVKIQGENEEVKKAMCNAMVSIGQRDERLREKSMMVAKEIGEVKLSRKRSVSPVKKLEKSAV